MDSLDTVMQGSSFTCSNIRKLKPLYIYGCPNDRLCGVGGATPVCCPQGEVCINSVCTPEPTGPIQVTPRHPPRSQAWGAPAVGACGQLRPGLLLVSALVKHAALLRPLQIMLRFSGETTNNEYDATVPADNDLDIYLWEPDGNLVRQHCLPPAASGSAVHVDTPFCTASNSDAFHYASMQIYWNNLQSLSSG